MVVAGAGAAVMAPEYAPVLALLTAATRNEYVVPFVRPVIVAVVALETPSTTVVHDPPTEARWMT